MSVPYPFLIKSTNPNFSAIKMDIIKNKILIKRILLVNQNNIEVLGDNFEFSEDSNKFGLVNNEKVIGIVTSKLIIPKLKTFLIQKNRSTSLNPK